MSTNIATRSVTLEVSNHHLTLQQVTVIPQNGCQFGTTFGQCGGELNGRTYVWTRENGDTNYALFTLSRIATISEVSLTYSVDSASEKPKVSFCAALIDTLSSICNSFPNLACHEMSTDATNGENRTRIVNVLFNNNTNSIVFEVIMQGINTSFTATSVQFFCIYVVGKLNCLLMSY